MRKISLVIFDLAGTVVDPYCIAPLKAFSRTFQKFGVNVSSEAIRKPMGLNKFDHIRELLENPDVSNQWMAVHGRFPRYDVEGNELYKVFVPEQVECVSRFSQHVNGAHGTFQFLRSRGVKIAGTTGYNKEIVESLEPIMKKRGLDFDLIVCSDDVKKGRPHPDMILKSMEELNVSNPIEVMNVDDSDVGVLAARNAGVFSVGSCNFSTHVNVNSRWHEASITRQLMRAKRQHANIVLRQAGADTVVGSVGEIAEMDDLCF